MEPFEVDNDNVDDEVFRQAETSIDLPYVPKKFKQTKSVTIS